VKTPPWIASLALTFGVAMAARPLVFEVRDGQTVEAEPGRIRVPEKRGRTGAKTLKLAFLRFKSTSAAPGAPIVYLAGGPGDSGIDDMRGVPLSLLNDLRGIGDVIALDQRGTGASEPRDVTCRYEPGLPLDRPGDPEAFARIFRDRMRECARTVQRRGADLAGFTTEESADDVEALRAALKAPKLTLLAGSYGSHLALAFIRRHPHRVERAILFGTEGPDQTFKLPSDVQVSLEKLAALAPTPDLMQAIRTLTERLGSHPVTVTIEPGVSVVVGAWDLQKRIADAMGRAGAMRQIPARLQAMLAGDFSDLGRWAYDYRRAISLSAMSVAMDCASYASAPRLERIRRETGSALLGATIDFPFPAICDGLDLPRLGDDFRAPLRSEVPVLFVSGELDGRTPVSNADEVAAGFANHQDLVVANTAHGIIGYPQLTPAVLAFLRGDRIPSSRVSFPAWEFERPSEGP